MQVQLFGKVLCSPFYFSYRSVFARRLSNSLIQCSLSTTATLGTEERCNREAAVCIRTPFFSRCNIFLSKNAYFSIYKLQWNLDLTTLYNFYITNNERYSLSQEYVVKYVEKKPETSLWRTYFVNPLTLCSFEVS